MAAPTITGIHHITAIASDPQRTVDFYTGVLGLRLVKLTVNFDDPGTYHLYFGDEHGAPGTILTFFPWPGALRGMVGNEQVSATAFAVPADGLAFWRSRLASERAEVQEAGVRFGDTVLAFRDPDGMPLEIVASAPAAEAAGPDRGAIPAAHAIRGFHGASIAEEGYERTATLLTDLMGLRYVGNEGDRFRYVTAGDRATVVDVICRPGARRGRLGAGTVHHIAWRTPDDAQQRAWRAALADAGYNVSPVMDRTYFHSIYYREPGGVLFEIATDPPGFAVDEAPDRIGERLMLPPWLEPERAAIERTLPPLTRPR